MWGKPAKAWRGFTGQKTQNASLQRKTKKLLMNCRLFSQKEYAPGVKFVP
jgi:hypothetical protein